jgi:sugar phosphate isomerase/epimerase
MQLGIFAKTFVRPTLAETLDALKDCGLDRVQFNMVCAGLPTLPERIEPSVAEDIREALAKRGLTMAAVSGTFNMIHPDQRQREDGLRRLAELARACPRLGTSVITLCTGTRDREDMWRRHPENDTPQAWRDLAASMREALKLTAESGVTLAFEPETANVVDTARKTRRLLDEIASPRLKVVMDGANLFHAPGFLERSQMHDVLAEAMELLGKEIVIAHAKELFGSVGEGAPSREAGSGRLDYDCYLRLLRTAGFGGPLIMHGLTEAQVPAAVAFLRSKMDAKG